jgi:hypothetical protein
MPCRKPNGNAESLSCPARLAGALPRRPNGRLPEVFQAKKRENALLLWREGKKNASTKLALSY